MVDIPLKDALLETIDSLKKRKARPDIERICHMLRRKRGISSADTKEALQKLVDAAVVVKVDYKGNTSYRNVAKWKKWGSRYCLNPFTTSSRVFAAVKTISEMQVRDGIAKTIFNPEGSLQDTDEADLAGATLVQITDWLKDVHPDLDLTRPPIDIMVEREVDVGHLDRLQDGRLVAWIPPQPKSPEHLSVKPKAGQKAKKSKSVAGRRSPTSSASTSSDLSGPSAISLVDQLSLLQAEQIKPDPDQPMDLSPTAQIKRKGAKRRKIKKTLGPDFESYGTVKKARRTSHEAATPTPEMPVKEEEQEEEEQEEEEEGKGGGERVLCDYCLQTASCNRKGAQEDLLICTDCQAKAHPSCMDYSSDLARRARRSPWQCIDCKTCCLCEDAGDPDAMLFCDACDKGYHMSCHSPVIEDKPTGKWVCSRCCQEIEADARGTMADNDCGPAGVLTPRQSPVQFTDQPQTSNGCVNGSVKLAKQSSWVTDVPNAADWSIDEVAQYFSNIGFIHQSEIFREQEIDGRSLLLLKRSDVLTGLSFKLGPALKIYSHVQQLQLRGQPVQ